MLDQNFVILGTLVGSVGSIGYIIDTIKGNAKPNRVSFLLWAIAPMIAFAAELKQGVGITALMTFSQGFFPILILLASFVNKRAVWKITKFDVICGCLSVLGLVLWLITKVGNLAIIFSILADGLAAIPTIVKSYKDPDSEVAWPWLATGIGSFITLLTVKEWTFANYGFILYIMLMCVTIFSLVQFRIGKKIKSNES